LIPKDKKLKDIELEFANELLNYAVYYNQTKINKEARDALMKAVFSTQEQTPETTESPAGQPVGQGEAPSAADQPKNYERIDDPLEIAKPWTPKKNKKVNGC
jgi:hypothetical protein